MKIRHNSALPETFLSSSVRLIFSLFQVFFKKRGKIVFQKYLLSLIFLMSKLTKYDFLVDLKEIFTIVIDFVFRNLCLNLDFFMRTSCSSFVMRGASLARTYFLLTGACLLNMQKTVSLKYFRFFLRHNFECLIETFHYQSVYNQGKPQCKVSVFEIPFLILLQQSYESRRGLFQRHYFVGRN